MIVRSNERFAFLFLLEGEGSEGESDEGEQNDWMNQCRCLIIPYFRIGGSDDGAGGDDDESKDVGDDDEDDGDDASRE